VTTLSKPADKADAAIKERCIGLTGAVATGKSTVGGILRSFGLDVIDADKLARDVVQPGQPTLQKIVDAFGTRILDEEKELDRSKLRDLVMTDQYARKSLERIIHPAIQSRFKEYVHHHHVGQSKLFFYEAALIFELHREQLFKETWATTCDEASQLERLQKRSNLPVDKCLEIIEAQWPAARKAQLATRIIDTNCSIPELTEKIKELIKATTTQPAGKRQFS
jgi:dephospho-CoA kinase